MLQDFQYFLFRIENQGTKITNKIEVLRKKMNKSRGKASLNKYFKSLLLKDHIFRLQLLVNQEIRINTETI